MLPLSQHLIKGFCQTKVRHTPPNPFNCGRNCNRQEECYKTKEGLEIKSSQSHTFDRALEV